MPGPLRGIQAVDDDPVLVRLVVVLEEPPLTGLDELLGEAVDVLQLAHRTPAGVAGLPVRMRVEPDRERLGEILVRMALRVPTAEVLHVLFAAWIGAVMIGIRFARAAEQALPQRDFHIGIGGGLALRRRADDAFECDRGEWDLVDACSAP